MNKNIGLLNLERPVVNTAMMQVSQYHKEQGDNVYDYHPLFNYDKTYCFSIFDFTDHKTFVTPDMICGGTGFNIEQKLPPEIEKCDYDWSIYPKCEYSILWFSRGCIRNCPFCIVRQKEGYIHSVKPKNLNPNGKWIQVQDNNFFANPKWRDAVDYLLNIGQPVDLQGVDVRLFDDEQGVALQELKHKKQIKIGWDNPRENLDDKIEHLLEYVKPHQVMCYVLVGFWSTQEEDLYRIYHLWDDYNIHPYVMPYNAEDEYQKQLRRWCNRKIIFKTRSWEEYWNGNRR